MILFLIYYYYYHHHHYVEYFKEVKCIKHAEYMETKNDYNIFNTEHTGAKLISSCKNNIKVYEFRSCERAFVMKLMNL
jgi:hypothetical protein